MQFTVPQNIVTPIATAVCVSAALVSGGLVVAQNVAKTTRDRVSQTESVERHNERARALETIAKEYRINNCWQVTGGTFTIDQTVPPLENGNRPSTCMISRDRSQLAYLAEYNGAMRMRFVFTAIELSNALSRLN